MIYCPQCGTPNKSNSKFCKNCAALLQPSTDIRCPICGTSNPQDAATCKSCGTRLSTSAAGTRPADKLSPADAPESITPFNPPELSQEVNAPVEKPTTADARHAFSRSNTEWLRRIGKTPHPEPPATSEEPSPPPLVESASMPVAPQTETPDWLRELQAEADKEQQAAAHAAPEPPAPAKPQLSEIKLTSDDYDYSDIGGEVTDEMKAQLQEQAANVESVEDEVALARRLLGLDIAAEVVSTAQSQAPAPIQTAAVPPESAAPIETPVAIEPLVPAQASAAPVVAESVAEIETPISPAPIAPEASALAVVSETVAPIETPAKPQLSEIKLTSDDYDYSDIGGEVTDEMKAQLQDQVANVESVEDEVALARRLLGLDIAAEVVSTATAKPVAPEPAIAPEAETIQEIVTLSVPVAQTQEPTTPIAPVAAAQEPATPIAPVTAAQETFAPVAPVTEAAVESAAVATVQEKQEQASPEWLAALAATSSAAVAANVLHGKETQAETENIPTAPTEPLTAVPIAAEAVVEAQAPAAEQAAPEPTIEPALAQEPIGEAPAAPTLESGTLPEWLREFAPPGEVGATDATIAEGERPAWAAPGAAALGAAAFVSHLPELDESEREELPEWLREPIAPVAPETGPAETAEPTAAEQALEAEGPVELPAWMQAGAPVGRDLFEVVETTGPLAGVSGILPLAVALTEPHTLSTPTPARSDGGRIFQTILAEPLAPAARAQSAAQPKKLFATRHWLYLLIFLAAFIPLFLPPGMDELGLLGKEVVNSPSAVFYDQLSAVPSNSTVLMAFEYTPGQSPELDPAARVILENLIARQVSVIALSSNPNGATIAQSLLERAQEAHPEFTFVNLGHILGNEAGLKNLALGWRRAADVDVNGVPWSQTPLSKKIQGMDDFALSVLLLGDNQTLNAWMMQVQPTAKSPLIAATTAAIDPQARVYVNSNQLRASLRGLTGAAELELWSGISGRAVKTVNALSFVMLTLAGIIVVANVVWLTRRGKQGNK